MTGLDQSPERRVGARSSILSNHCALMAASIPTRAIGECCLPLRHPILVFGAVFGNLAGRGVPHSDLLEARAKITTYNRLAHLPRAFIYKSNQVYPPKLVISITA